MLVNGGRSGWARVGSCAALVGVLGLISTIGCGSRTSMLDPDAYGVGHENVGNGGSGNLGPKPNGSAGKATSGGGLLGNGGASSSGSRGGSSASILP